MSKLTDADGELAETRHWISTAEACAYLKADHASVLGATADRVGARLGSMIQKYTTADRVTA